MALVPLFENFAPPIREQSPLRKAITAAFRRSEPECVVPLLGQARMPDADRARIRKTASMLVAALRSKPRGTGVEALVQEYALSSQEGIALMCLAEALLRIPDRETRDALIRDKIAGGDWGSHLGDGRSLYVNAATWGLIVTGKLAGSVNETGLSAALRRIVARAGEPVIRSAVDLAIRMMGEQFVTAETIGEALKRASKREAIGFLYSYDMLGEAATSAADAERYFRDYEAAVEAIGAASGGRGVYSGPGISIKLSALHPRYSRAQASRVMRELLPRVKALALMAKRHDVGLNIDAEEADRLELSLDILESLALDPDLAGWDGLGFVVQAYGKRCPFVIDWIVDLAKRSERRIMVRLVKGAYWDTEIKRAQVDGLADFPVYTRKVHTDVAYIACARKLLDARAHVFPQFATHNAQSLATIYHLAGPEFALGDYEFQCLHGMGEPLYDEVVGADKLNRPCRVYAPVGSHETLLAYLVRRLLENGANSSFVNRIGDPDIPVADLVEDPAEIVAASKTPGESHPAIAKPPKLYGTRRNSRGFDLADESVLAALGDALRTSVSMDWQAAPADGQGIERAVLNPADHRDTVGLVTEATVEQARQAAQQAQSAAQKWAAVPITDRAVMLERAADALETAAPHLLGLIMREAGKSLPNAISEVREAADFLRYYAQQASRSLTEEHTPLGVVACISPWNFPLAIFTGQVAAALVAGNAVLAKPAEETPLIAAQAVAMLHAAGVPPDVLQLVPGGGTIGAALVAAPETMGVIFTGSTEVARLIQSELALRVSPEGQPIPLIAETGGQNAMIVDSSALAEQVVADVIASAFDSAGQRCSALRLLCLQEEVADRTLAMLKGALAELHIGRPDQIDVDLGPVITADAQATIEQHIERMRGLGRPVYRQEWIDQSARGTFVAPTIIELERVSDLRREVFGPVLHVIRFKRDELDRLIDDINATGYGLTFGLHTRLDEMIDQGTGRIKAGNLYVNRNVIGAVVGVQPFGGRGLSGTGPKAGGPLYLGRLVKSTPVLPELDTGCASQIAQDFAAWLESIGEAEVAQAARSMAGHSLLGVKVELPGPVGERNLYAIHPRGVVLLLPESPEGLLAQIAAGLACGNHMVIGSASRIEMPQRFSANIHWSDDWVNNGPFDAAIIEGSSERVKEMMLKIGAMPGPVVLTQSGRLQYRLDWLVEEVSTSINTTAAGGNASLMAMA